MHLSDMPSELDAHTVSHTLIELGEHTIKLDQERNMEIASELKSMPIAIETQSANNQHFLVLAAYYY